MLGGQLFAAGGHDGPLVRKSVEVYDSQSNTWRLVCDMNMCRRNAGPVTTTDTVPLHPPQPLLLVLLLLPLLLRITFHNQLYTVFNQGSEIKNSCRIRIISKLVNKASVSTLAASHKRTVFRSCLFKTFLVS